MIASPDRHVFARTDDDHANEGGERSAHGDLDAGMGHSRSMRVFVGTPGRRETEKGAQSANEAVTRTHSEVGGGGIAVLL